MSEELRVIIADVVPIGTHRDQLEVRLEELRSLVTTLGGAVIVDTVQKKTKPDYKMFLGSGKMEEIKEAIETLKVDVLIIGNTIKPRQLYTINEYLRPVGATCWDRVDLILKIFDQHAVSTESKLQIELAAIKHMGPRIVGMGMELSRQSSGIGGSGLGETNTEIMRRHLQMRREQIEKKLREYEKMRKLHRDGRRRRGLKTVGLVGYTNAGKSTLLTSLTNKEAYVEDKLFATLGTQVGSMRYYPEGTYKPTEVLVSDTVGFIRDLPPNLIKAFKSTLEDSIESELLLHVIDTQDPQIDQKIAVVDEILENIGANQKGIYVFNKIDGMDEEHIAGMKERYSEYEAIFVSAREMLNIEELKEKITQMIG